MKTKLKTTKQRVDGLLAVCPVCTADQKERVYQAMVEEYELGFAEGHKAGQDEDYKQGHSEGLEKGRKEAQQEAYSKGWADGRRSGLASRRGKIYAQAYNKAREESLATILIEVLKERPGKAGRDEVVAKILKELAPFATPSHTDSQTDQTGQLEQAGQTNQTDLPVQTDQTGLTDQTGQLDLSGQADKMDLPSLVAKRFAEDAAWNCGPARAQGLYGPRREGAMAGEAPLAGSG
ncbi:MAG: hypothetical protein J5863_08715, partial [Desulfovibrio sp.]|nr:hypothetical protein [Desulfovibrio sp.]